ncbi:MAG: hypothetical protein K2X82_16365 [Gemmataceae bacterium]|nr:hypothetical protein [Gemmataceae bacterium]
MVRTLIVLAGLGAAAATATLAGCNKPQPPAEKAAAPHKDGDHKDADHKGGDHKGEGHGHKPGAHGGTIVSLGQDSYHAEVVFEKDGGVRLYMLGKDESTPQEVQVQDLVGYVTPAGATDAVQVKFAADPQKGDAAGKTTQFAAKLPHDLHGKAVRVTINNVQVGAERFRVEFSNEKDGKDGKAGHGH